VGKRDHWFIRCYTFQWTLANDSFDALGYLYPSTHPFEVTGLCGSVEECQTHTRSYPSHTSAKLLIHRLAHALYVCLVLGLVQGVPTL
jgi:hypothetical protein